jgi:thiol-disulfide isomerase/thioredoxin
MMLPVERYDNLKFKDLGRCVLWPAVIVVVLLTSCCAQAQQNGTSGTNPMSLKFTSLDGRKVDVGSLKGKFVLIDCWATWCVPCLKEMAHIKAMYEKYGSRCFEVIGISMDDRTSKDRVKKILQEKNIFWTQRFEGKEFLEDSFRKPYNIGSLPAVYLLDRQGKDCGYRREGEQIERLLREYLGV